MTKHEKARKALDDGFTLKGSTAEEYMILSNYIDEAEESEKTHQNKTVEMTFREVALGQARKYGMTKEVEMIYERNVKKGYDEEKAWRYSLMDWDLWPYKDEGFLKQWDDTVDKGSE